MRPSTALSTTAVTTAVTTAPDAPDRASPHRYQVGGSLLAQSPGYIHRQADSELYEAIRCLPRNFARSQHP